MKVVDTTFLIDLLRGEEKAMGKARELDAEGGAATTVINVYELFIGLHRAVDPSSRRFVEADRVLARLDVFPLDFASAKRSARYMAELISAGGVIDTMDVMTGAIALENGSDTVVSRNVSHFERMPDLKVEPY